MRVLTSRNISFEIIFVDDGSKDNTYSEIEKIVYKTSRLPETLHQMCAVQAISFSRNFGKDAALYAGLEHAGGRCVAFIDADLQHPLETLADMYEVLISDDDVDCVAAYQKTRKSSALRNYLSSKFYGMLASTSNMDVVANASDFRIFKRNVAEALLSMGENERFTKGLFAWIGFKTKSYPYQAAERKAGTTSWSFVSLVRYAITGLISFSTVPLKIASYLGVGVSFAAIVYFLVVAGKRLFFGVEIPGYATIVGLVLLLGGIQLLVLGAIGEYLARTYMQGKERPIYIARKQITSKQNIDVSYHG